MNNNNNQQKWDKRFMGLASAVGMWSKDLSTKVGCVIVSPNRDIIATGYNGFPRKINDNNIARHERPEKYFWAEHAERNTIYAAAKMGHALEGATIYVVVAEGAPLFPCADCARAMIQSGIKCIVAEPADLNNSKWGPDFRRALEMLKEAGVEIRYIN
jgi:dCMP deaminase